PRSAPRAPGTAPTAPFRGDRAPPPPRPRGPPPGTSGPPPARRDSGSETTSGPGRAPKRGGRSARERRSTPRVAPGEEGRGRGADGESPVLASDRGGAPITPGFRTVVRDQPSAPEQRTPMGLPRRPAPGPASPRLRAERLTERVEALPR